MGRLGGYLNSIEKFDLGINVAGMVGHTAVRYYVMGERSVEELATDEEIQKMADIVGESMDGGAVGFSTTDTHLMLAQTAGHSRYLCRSQRTFRNSQSGR
ncbi:MAG: hypothetical protein Ct9H300mP3_06710 [Gammaproteobacteria bacterium]|nr:MAG: hypothetical protein Ct9H300mP3_06710 [Gammaproteobacteria bacterium]